MADRFVTQTGCTVIVARPLHDESKIILHLRMDQPGDLRHAEVMFTQDEWEQLSTLKPGGDRDE